MLAGRSISENLDLGTKLERILEEELGPTARYILKKQYRDTSLDPKLLKLEDVDILSHGVQDLLNKYLGEDATERLHGDIFRDKNILFRRKE